MNTGASTKYSLRLVLGLIWGVGMGSRIFLILGLCFFIVGCASSSEEIAPSYVSPLQYQHLSCAQISSEMERVSQHAAKLAGVTDSNATKDKVTTAVAVVVFWPAAFLVKGDGQQAAELARLKGEFQTLEKVAIQKKCQIDVQNKPDKKTS